MQAEDPTQAANAGMGESKNDEAAFYLRDFDAIMARVGDRIAFERAAMDDLLGRLTGRSA